MLNSYSTKESLMVFSAVVRATETISLADSKMTGSEMDISGPLFTGAAERYPKNSIIQAGFSKEVFSRNATNFPQDSLSINISVRTLECIEAALKIVSKKATPAEIKEYKLFIYQTAEKVAQAGDDRSSGISTRNISPQEKAALQKLAIALDITQDMMLKYYSLEESFLLFSTVFYLASTVSLADGIESNSEVEVLRPLVTGAAEKYPKNSIIQAAFSMDAFGSNIRQFMFASHPNPSDLNAHAFESLKAVLALISTRATPEEIKEYKSFIYMISETIAKASEDGSSGIDVKNINPKEKTALQQLKAALSL